MKLRRREFCPLHKSLFCCGRSQNRNKRLFPVAVQRIEDPHHPRGYRELRSSAEMRRLLKQKTVEQGNKCGICGELFTDVRDIVPDHKDPRGMGGARRDDHPDNIQAAHRLCNLEKGSRRVPDGTQLQAPAPEESQAPESAVNGEPLPDSDIM